jgi:ATP-dependent protease ClpP protease subunit
MSKRKRNDSEETETVTEENALISVTNNKIMFYSDVEPPSVFKLIKAIDEATKYVNSINANMLDNDIPIYLHICSDGGDLYAALAIIDIILESTVRIVTICEGCVASAGVLIALAGQERYIRKHAYMLIHEIRSGCNGKYSECKDDMINNDILMKDMKKYMNERTNNRLLKKELDKILVHDIIWDAETCLKYGLINKIL